VAVAVLSEAEDGDPLVVASEDLGVAVVVGCVVVAGGCVVVAGACDEDEGIVVVLERGIVVMLESGIEENPTTDTPGSVDEACPVLVDVATDREVEETVMLESAMEETTGVVETELRLEAEEVVRAPEVEVLFTEAVELAPEAKVLFTEAVELAAGVEADTGGELRLDPGATPAATVHCRTT